MEAIASDLRPEGQRRKGSGWGQGREGPASTASSAPRQQVPLKSVLVLRGSIFFSLSLVRREAAGNLRGPAYETLLSATHPVVVSGPALTRACRAGGRGPGQLCSRPPGPTIPRVCGKAQLPVSAAWELPEEVMGGHVTAGPPGNWPGLWKVPHRLPVLAMCVPPTIPIARACSRSKPRESIVWLRPSRR